MNHCLRILAVNWRCQRHPQAGGAEINLFEQARRWRREGHEVTIVCADPGREYAPLKDEMVNGIRIHRMGNRFTVYLLALIYYVMHAGSFDRIVDVSNGIPFFTPLLTNLPGVLVVHHVHGKQWFSEFPYPVAAFGWFLERVVVPLLYRSWPVITVSPTTRQALIDIGFDPFRIFVVYNGIKLPAQPPSKPDSNHPRIAYVGRLKRYKRIDRLVRMVAELRVSIPGIHLDIAGDGDTRPEIEKLVKKLDLQECVSLHGYIDEQTKASILSSATVFATPSMHEGWGLSVIEANAYGCPAVAFDVPGLCVSIRHGVTGLLAKDDASFRQALVSIINSPSLRDELANGATAWASRFSWDSCAKNTLEVLESWNTAASMLLRE